MMSTAAAPAIKKTCKPRSCGGFTLIELLVAIMILTLLMTASLGAVRIASRSWEAGHSRADMTEQMRASSNFLRRQFGQLILLKWIDGNDERIAFTGEHDQIRFIAPAPQHSHGAGYLEYELAVNKGDNGQILMLSFSPFDPGDIDFGEPNLAGQLILATDFKDVSFDFFGVEIDDEQPSWKRSWRRDAERYPTAIRIRASVDDARGTWPELVLPLRQREEI